MKDGEKNLPPAFGLKDIFTIINLSGGIMALLFCGHGRPDLGAYAVLLGFLLGDSLDGPVARWTNTGNRFGSEFDSLADHLSQCISPAVILYTIYRDQNQWLAGVMAFALIIAGTMRHARLVTVSFSFPGAYLGLPRTVSAFLLICFSLSKIISSMPGSIWTSLVLTLLLSAGNLACLPFRTHRSGQKIYEKGYAFSFFAMMALTLILMPAYTFDVVFMWLTIYSIFSWLALEPHERKAFFARARWWRQQLRQAR
jgi:phosphatidylserine synthase